MTISYLTFLWTCIRLSYVLSVVAILCMHRSFRLFASLLITYNSRYEYCFLSDGITFYTTNYMSITKRLKITISPIRLHSASSLQIPSSTAKFNSLLPTVNVSHLKLHSVSSINLYGASNYNIFRNHLRIRLSPIKSPIHLKYKNPYKRTVSTLIFLSAMPRVAPAAII